MASTTTALLDDLLSREHASTDACKAATALDLVLDGDADALRCLLQSDASRINVNARSATTGRALLHEACAEGSLEIVKLLLEKTDADLMLRTLLGRCTPLHLAVTNNHRAVVFLLLSYGADALSRDRFGSSPMHYVKSLSVAKLLIQYGGRVLDYNARRKNALESVLVFAESGHVEDDDTRRAFRKFLQHQAELEYKRKLETLRQIKQAQVRALRVSGGKSSPSSALHKRSKNASAKTTAKARSAV